MFIFRYQDLVEIYSVSAETIISDAATGPCIANQLRDVNTICRRSWYIAAHIWKIYVFKIEVVPFIINFPNPTRNACNSHGRIKAQVMSQGFFLTSETHALIRPCELQAFLVGLGLELVLYYF
jgi:hypothetical protein